MIDPYDEEIEDDELNNMIENDDDEDDDENLNLDLNNNNNHDLAEDENDESPETTTVLGRGRAGNQSNGVEEFTAAAMMREQQGAMNHLVESSGSSRHFDATTRMLVEFLVSTGQPLSVFDNFRLRSFVAELSPAYVVPASSTVEFEYLPELVQLMQDDVRQEIACVDHVAITLHTIKSNLSGLKYTGKLT